jgi:hypothetical protein
MPGTGDRRTFNIVLVALAAVFGLALAISGWGPLRSMLGEGGEPPPDPARIAGEPQATMAPDRDGLDRTTLGDAAARKPTAPPVPPRVTLSLPGGARVQGTPAEADLLAYLETDAAAGRRFALPSIAFVENDAVRQSPDGALTTLAAILQAFPRARIRVEVIERNPQMFEPHDRATARAQAVARAIVAQGVDAGRVTHAGVKSTHVETPRVELVVVAR